VAPEGRRSDGALSPPVLGRPSAAASRPGRLRLTAGAADAAYRADGGDAPTLSVRAASVVGVRHRLAGQGCDDSFAWRWITAPDPLSAAADHAGTTRADEQGSDWVVVAVADGVGTVAGSALSAAAAVSVACEAAACALLERGAGLAAGEPAAGGVDVSDVRDPSWWAPVLRQAAEAVSEVGGATTLVVAVVDAAGMGAVARIGDSTALVLVNGQWRDLWAVEADDGTVSTLTAALPASSAVEVADVSLEPGAALVLLTDGVANPLRDGPTTVAPALAAALAGPPNPLELAVLADFSRQGCFDDRTILGIWVGPATDPPELVPAGT
jgi:serine/threonine protein phosphatase PrpC